MQCQFHICKDCTCKRRASFVHANQNLNVVTKQPKNPVRKPFLDAVREAEITFKGTMKRLS